MMTFISCAKTMTARSKIHTPGTSVPRFEKEAEANALHMGQFSPEQLGKLLRVNPKLAAENCLRYHNFFSEDNRPLPALTSYTGIVFKRISPTDFSEEDFLFAQNHLLITSFLYGLLRPLDGIKNYRLEGDVKLAETGYLTMFDYWKPLLTDYFIGEIKKQGGILVNLASGEMKELFDWNRVCREVQVITPEFYVMKNRKPSTVVVYTKMCRGEMTRYILKNRIESPEALKGFEWEGFSFDESLSTPHSPVFTLM